MLAVLLSFANLIETWATELVINPIIGVAEFGGDVIGTIFYGALGRVDSPAGAILFADDPLAGLIQALDTSWAGIFNILGGLSISALPVAVIFAGLLAFLLGRVINRV